MGDIRSADPEHLQELANRLSTVDDGGAYGKLVELIDRARRLDASDEVGRLSPLLTWLRDASGQLREGAAILNGESPIAGLSAADLAAGYGSDDDGVWDWEVFGVDNADAFLALALQDELSAQELDDMRGYLAPFAGDPGFAGYLIDELGMEQFLSLSQRIDAAAADLQDTSDADTLQTLLGTALAGAMWVPGNALPDSSAYREWSLNTPQGQRYAARLDAFNSAGGQLMGRGEEALLGFEVALGLLERSETPVDAQFFNQTMTHLAAPFASGNDPCPRWPREVADRFMLLGARTNPLALEDYLGFEDQDARVDWATGLIGEGREMTELERATLIAVLENNAGDPAFTELLLRDFGPEATMDFAALLVDSAHDGDLGAAAREDYGRLQAAFADSLASGMRDTEAEWYTDFMSGLPEAGIEEYSVGFTDEKVRGYQLLVTLLQEGSGYADAFMFDIADGIRRAEDPDLGGDPTLWQEYRPLNADAQVSDTHPAPHDGLDPEEHEWFTLDPLDGMLGVMSRDPEAATAFLDPQGGNDRLAYLISERAWEFIDEAVPGGMVSYTGPRYEGRPFGDTREADNARTGLGLLLHAATTGHELGNPAAHGFHTPAQSRVMHEAIELFDTGEDADELLASDAYRHVREPFTSALAEYSADIFGIVTGDAPKGRDGGDHSVNADDGLGRLGNGRDSVIRVMRGLSEDTDNYDALSVAQNGYIGERLEDMPRGYDDPETIELRLAESKDIGEVFGTMSGIGADMILDMRDADKNTYLARMRYGGNASSWLLGRIPSVGSFIAAGLDLGYFETWRSANAEADDWSRDKLGNVADESQDQVDGIFRTWAEQYGLGENSGPVEGASSAAQGGFIDGRGNVHHVLRGEF